MNLSYVRHLHSTRSIPGYEGEEPLTKDAIQKLVTDTVNGVVNSAMANFRKTDLPKIVKDSLTENLTPITAQFDSINEALKALKPAEPGSGAPPLPPEVSAELKNLKDGTAKMQKQVDDMKAERDAADDRAKKLERSTKIRAALGNVKEGFSTEASAQTAFLIVEPLVKELEDGTLVGGDNLPVEDFVKDYLPKQHPYLLKGTGASGAGASGGSQGNRGGRVATLEMIKPGMTAEERSNVLTAIQNAGNNR